MRRSVMGCCMLLPHAWRIPSEVWPTLCCATLHTKSAERLLVSPRRGVRCRVDRLCGHNSQDRKGESRAFGKGSKSTVTLISTSAAMVK